MTNTIFIPNKIKVGFQNRSDTYSKKLAYIIYYDQNNKLRKEASFESWRSNTIEPEDYENIPVEGFIINKHIGGCNSGWNHRKSYIRIYDPRGFEFEISVENLLYILETNNSVVGKGLEGRFIYGWDGTELVLIPTNSNEYSEIIEYSSKIKSNEFISAKDLKVGVTYINKKQEPFVYLGKYEKYEVQFKIDDHYENSRNGAEHYCIYNSIPYSAIQRLNINRGSYFVFSNNDSSYDYFTWKKSITKQFIECIDDNVSKKLDTLLLQLASTKNYSPIDLNKTKLVKYKTLEELVAANGHSRQIKCFIQQDKIKSVAIKPLNWNDLITSETLQKDSNIKYKIVEVDANNYYINKPDIISEANLHEIFSTYDFYYYQLYLENGNEYERCNYYTLDEINRYY